MNVDWQQLVKDKTIVIVESPNFPTGTDDRQGDQHGVTQRY
jgi:hypothetical protein